MGGGGVVGKEVGGGGEKGGEEGEGKKFPLTKKA